MKEWISQAEVDRARKVCSFVIVKRRNPNSGGWNDNLGHIIGFTVEE